MSNPHIWLRAESKPGEARRALAPEHALQLARAGFTVTVERDSHAAIGDADYGEAGCTLVESHSWPQAPQNCFVLGLKELPEGSSPLQHRHIYFAHAYKEQRGWQHLLRRFQSGGGTLLDLEYLVDDNGRRLAAFGYWAGYVGAALAVLCWSRQQDGQSGLRALIPWADRADLLKDVAEALAARESSNPAQPSAIIVGAAGRVGSGAAALSRDLALDATLWDLAETRSGGPFTTILRHDLMINCVLATGSMPPFLTRDLLDQPDRRLSVIADVSCDPYGPHNPLPLYSSCTSLESPTLSLKDSPAPLDLIAIDNLPSLLPIESSQDFSAQLLPALLALADRSSPVWQRAQQLFEHKCALIDDREVTA